MSADMVFRTVCDVAFAMSLGYLIWRQSVCQADTEKMLRKICERLPGGELIGVGRHAEDDRDGDG